MKKLYYSVIVVIVWLFTACENDRQLYDTNVSALNISFVDTVYTFATKASTVEEDTVWLKITLIGDARDYARDFKVKATPKTTMKENYHYRLLDLRLEANTVLDTLPLLVYRKADLKDSTFVLELELVPNENFIQGASRKTRLEMTDRLVAPSNWDSDLKTFFGVYSQTKHQLIIDATGIGDFKDLQIGTIRNMALMAQNYLDELNAARKEDGLGPLTDEFDREVKIGN